MLTEFGSSARSMDRRRNSTGRNGLRALAGRLDPVVAGRCLLLFSGAGVGLAALLLTPSEHDLATLVRVSAAMTVLLAASFLVRWRRLPRAATVAFPMTALLGFAILGLSAPHMSGALTGLLTGVYLYTGLTQRPGSSLWVVPLGCATFVAMNGGLTDTVLVRLVIGAFVWTSLVEILAALASQQQRLAQALTDAAHRDALTGIPNRRDLQVRLMSVRPGDALVICDLDHFKIVNDKLGHHVGDRTLAAFGDLLRLHMRADDYCARYGGEEFVLLLPDTDPASADAVLVRLRAAWRLMEQPTTFSAGIAPCLAEQGPAETLVAADSALYAAKAAGRDAIRTHQQAPCA